MISIQFRSMKEIQDYYQKQVRSGNSNVLNNLKTKNGKTYGQATDQMLKDEAKRLYDCIQRYIDDHYDSFEPRYYERTEGLKNALQVEAKVSTGADGKKYIGLYFDDSLSWGKSWVDGEWSGYKPELMNSGFKNKTSANPTFAGFYGLHFIEKGVAEWQATLDTPVDVKVIGMTGKFGAAGRMGYDFG